MEHSRLIDFITTSSVPFLTLKDAEYYHELAHSNKNKNDNIDNKNKNNNVDNKNKSNKNVRSSNDNDVNIDSNKIEVVVADMMAGVGPFAVPLAINRITVYANDLNPESFKYLNKNMKLNHCEKFLHTHNQCAR